jgi:hypothetical protein
VNWVELKVNLAIRTLNADTRLRVLFKKKSPTDTQWIQFETEKPWPYSNCPAYVKEVGKHPLKTEKGETESIQSVFISDWAEVGHVMHELLHVLGFVHGHQRDRSRQLHRDQSMMSSRRMSIIREMLPVFHPTLPYDIASIMHYLDCHIRQHSHLPTSSG